jgi:hypothetical protein
MALTVRQGCQGTSGRGPRPGFAGTLAAQAQLIELLDDQVITNHAPHGIVGPYSQAAAADYSCVGSRAVRRCTRDGKAALRALLRSPSLLALGRRQNGRTFRDIRRRRAPRLIGDPFDGCGGRRHGDFMVRHETGQQVGYMVLDFRLAGARAWPDLDDALTTGRKDEIRRQNPDAACNLELLDDQVIINHAPHWIVAPYSHAATAVYWLCLVPRTS